jgi:chaperonin cofactor prefoldin
LTRLEKAIDYLQKAKSQIDLVIEDREYDVSSLDDLKTVSEEIDSMDCILHCINES